MLVDHHFFAVFHGNLFKKMSGTFEDVWVHISCVVGLEDVQLLNRVFCGLVLWSGGPFHAERWFRPLPKADKKSIFEVYLLKVEYPKPKQRIGTQRFWSFMIWDRVRASCYCNCLSAVLLQNVNDPSVHLGYSVISYSSHEPSLNAIVRFSVVVDHFRWS